MSELLDEILSEESPKSECQVCSWLKTNPPDKEEWIAVLADRSRQHAAISRVFTKRGIPNMAEPNVRRHRKNHIWNNS